MITAESKRMCGLVGGVAAPPPGPGSVLGLAMLGCVKVVSAGGAWKALVPKPGGVELRETMAMFLSNAEEAEISGIGQGIHRPYKIGFRGGLDAGPMTTRMGVFKTIHSQMESKRYCRSMDLSVAGPEREILAYELDLALGFDLVPPTVGRHVSHLGFGSVQAWVNSPTGWCWLDRGYDYHTDLGNPWVHRLAAFHFIVSAIDAHANNFIIDDERRYYSIDNGYSFTKHEGAVSRGYIRSSILKALGKENKPIHPQVAAEIASAPDDRLFSMMQDRGFKHGEPDGMMERLSDLRRASAWSDLRYGELLAGGKERR